VDGKDEDFTHRADRTITAGTRKTARRVRIASHYEFATHTGWQAIITIHSSCPRFDVFGDARKLKPKLLMLFERKRCHARY
jgi:hypothetical protein